MIETVTHEQKKTIWAEFLEIPIFQLESMDELSRLILGYMSEWGSSKYDSKGNLEIELLNSLEVRSCPFYQGRAVAKGGYQKNGTRRYCYKACGKRF